jgi:4-hydroxy-2-oxoheptanedioate aldolase
MTLNNSFKTRLRQPGAQIGLWLGLADPYAAELCATTGFDWLLIDGEHGPNDLRTMLGSLQAVAPYPVHPVVRIPQGDATLVKQVLEIGATTLLVPMVESVEQAHGLVRAMRYPPQGIRGVGAGLARSSRWNGHPNYLKEANDQVCLLVQVETIEALAQIEAIAAVEGVDGVFIGPADLAASMGHLGAAELPEVVSAIDDAIRRVVAMGKAVGILAVNEARARACIALGVRFVAVGVDTTLMTQAARALSARFRETAPAAP